MASSKNPNSTANAGLFGTSFDNNAAFSNFAGPKLFTPAPVTPVPNQQIETKSQDTNIPYASPAQLLPTHENTQTNRKAAPAMINPPLTARFPQDSVQFSTPTNQLTNMASLPKKDDAIFQPSIHQNINRPPSLHNIQANSPAQLLQRPTQVVSPQPKLATSTLPTPPTHSNTIGDTIGHTSPNIPSSTLPNVSSSVQPNDPTYLKSLSPVEHHWFYLKNWTEWTPFSYYDSKKIEFAYQNKKLGIVPTEGGRFDVNLASMQKTSVYWPEAPCQVQRCSWFFKGDTESKLTPYAEDIAQKLEQEYMAMMAKGIYNIRVNISERDFVIFHNPNVLVHYVSNIGENLDWTGEDSKIRPKVVKRGITEIEKEIEHGEPDDVDHLVFVVHGIGPVADIRMRSIVECVNDFRKNSLDLSQTHEIKIGDKLANRVEFLPIQWHSKLRQDRSDVDRQLKSLSLPSIMKLRNFTNETLTDILFYTSPTYCQAICDTIVSEMNQLHHLFKSRNPKFKGSVSLVGHSLGSCILFDILANQITSTKTTDTAKENNQSNKEIYEDAGENVEVVSKKQQQRSAQPVVEDSPLIKQNRPSIDKLLSNLGLSKLLSMFGEEQIDTDTLMMCSEADLRDLDIPFGPRKKLLAFIKKQESAEKGSSTNDNNPDITNESIDLLTRGTQTAVNVNDVNGGSTSITDSTSGTISVNYPKLEFKTDCLFCFGSPLGLFLTCRGVSTLGLEYKLPTCKKFVNIFHPYDPVVYRLEPLVNSAINIQPVQIPHHKGRKRFHLELKENLSRVSANLKSGFLDAVNRTWSSINDFARAHRSQLDADQQASMENDETLQTEANNMSLNETSLETTADEVTSVNEPIFDYGTLNDGNRIDYVLQEKPFELLNEYIFALGSHSCYWTSEDTALLLLNEIYGTR